MGYVHTIQLDNNSNYLIEPILFATAGGTSIALTASINNFELVAGTYVNIKVGTVGTHATLNVSNTGAKSIYYNNVQISANMLTANNIYTFVYDGTNWNVLGDIAGQNVMIGTTAEWQQRYNQVYPRGMIVIYSDHGTVTEIDANQQEVTKTVPGIKITDGSTPISSLPFIGDDEIAAIRTDLSSHINDNIAHVTAEDRTKWDHKINASVTDHVLSLNYVDLT